MSSDRLLIIDDEPGMAKLVARVGESCGFRATATHSAAAFKAAYTSETPDLLVLDLAIPDEDGIELLRFLAAEGCDAPILLMSGFDAKVLEVARQLGEARGLMIAGTISKPVRTVELQSMLLKTQAAGREG